MSGQRMAAKRLPPPPPAHPSSSSSGLPGSKHHLADAARRLVFRGKSHGLEGPCGASDPLLQAEAELLDALLTSATLLVGAAERWLHQLNQCHFNPPEKQQNNLVLRKDVVK